MLSERKGFTLVELLVVMGIILVLISIAVPATNSARNKAKDTEVKAACNTIQAALEQHAVDSSGFYPGTHWVQDTNGNWHAGPGVIGAVPTFTSGEPNQDYYVPKDISDPRSPYLPDSTPNVNVLDKLVVNGYIEDYPANPFLRTTGGVKAQMTNLFLLNPLPGGGGPYSPLELDWNKLTSPGESMRVQYIDRARGHFSYIPFNPVNNTGIDYPADWGSLTNQQRSDYFKNCRGYMLIGWGHSRIIDNEAKGISEKFWSNSEGAFDFDNSLTADFMETVLSDTTNGGLVYPEMVDSDGSVGAYGQALIGGGVDADQMFFGSVFLHSPNS